LTGTKKLVYIQIAITNYPVREVKAIARKSNDDTPVEQSRTVIKGRRSTGMKQPGTRIKAKQPTRVVKRVTVIQQEHPQGIKWLGVNPWVIIAAVIALLLLVLLPIYPAEKTVDKTGTVMVPVTKEKPEQVTTQESIKTYQGYMVEQGGSDPGPVIGTTTGSPWSGSWRAGLTTYDEILTTSQNGTQLTGNWTTTDDNDRGQLTGTVSGYQFTGRWAETPSYQPPNDAGDEELTLATNGQSMTGRWRYGSSGTWNNITYIRTGPGAGTATGTRTGTGGSITIDAVAEIVEVQRARGPNDTWILTLTAYDGTQTIYRNIVKDDLTKTGKATVQVTKTVNKPYTEQESRQVTKPAIVKYRVNLVSLILQDY